MIVPIGWCTPWPSVEVAVAEVDAVVLEVAVANIDEA